MDHTPTYLVGAGFGDVDAQPDPQLLVGTMDDTTGWPTVIELRAHEHRHLAAAPGDAVLDLGCGRGEVTCALAARVAPTGRAIGVDTSTAMLTAARSRASDVGLDVAFLEGDALDPPVDDRSWDVVRAERLAQWLPDLDAAVARWCRLLAPGGRLGLIDTDWRTLSLDLPDLAASAAFTRAMVDQRGPSAAAGGRLLNACRNQGLDVLSAHAATHVWTGWNPDTHDAPSGFFPMTPLVEQLVAGGHLEPARGRQVLDQTVEAGRSGRFAMSVTITSVVAIRSVVAHRPGASDGTAP